MSVLAGIIPNQPDGSFKEEWGAGWEDRWTTVFPCSPAVIDGKLKVSPHSGTSFDNPRIRPAFTIDGDYDFEVEIRLKNFSWCVLYNGEYKYCGFYNWPSVTIMCEGGSSVGSWPGSGVGFVTLKFVYTKSTHTTKYYSDGVLRATRTNENWDGVVCLDIYRDTPVGGADLEIEDVVVRQTATPSKVVAGGWDGYPWINKNYLWRALSDNAVYPASPYSWEDFDTYQGGTPWRNHMLCFTAGEGSESGGENEVGIGLIVPYESINDTVAEGSGYRISPDIVLPPGWHWKEAVFWKTGLVTIQLLDNQNALIPNQYVPGNSTGISEVDLSGLPDSYTTIRFKMTWANRTDKFDFILYGFRVLAFPYTATAAEIVDETVVLTADADATTTYYSWDNDQGPFSEYTIPIEIPAGAADLYFYSQFSDYTEDVQSLVVAQDLSVLSALCTVSGDTITLSQVIGFLKTLTGESITLKSLQGTPITLRRKVGGEWV